MSASLPSGLGPGEFGPDRRIRDSAPSRLSLVRPDRRGIVAAMKLRRCSCAVLFAGTMLSAAEPANDEEGISLDDVLIAGKSLFEEYAPADVQAQFEFPDRARWDDTIRRLQAALEGNDPRALLQFEPEVRAALTALRALPGAADYVDWLAERLDYIEAAKQIPRTPPKPPPKPPGDKTATQFIPHYDLWLRRTQQRAKPPAAAQLVSRLKPVFASAGVPGDLVWLAEVESSFNPAAKSPVGARGLFQLMPATAKELGLSTLLPDERTDPEKAARAAATYLRRLHARFGDWPLAIAAYNAGGGRISRALQQQNAKTFAEIAPTLAVETQMYVPKVLATLQVRSGTLLTGPGRK
jgi:membrane-bound lytic murein transglycosylase D